MSVERAHRAWAWVTGLMVSLGCVAVVASLFLPLLRDEGGYLFIADRVAHGAVYARDYFEWKTPLFFYLVAWLFRITGTSVFAARLAMLGCVAASAWLITGAARSAGIRPRWRAGAVALFLLLVPAFYSSHALTEVPVMVCSIGLAVLLLRGEAPHPVGTWVSAGLIIGVAASAKQVGVFLLPAAVIWIWVENRRSGVDVRSLIVRAAALSVAFAIPLAAWALYYLVIGAFPEFLYAAWSVAASYRGFGFVDWVLNTARSVVLRGLIIWVPLAAGVPVVLWRYLRRSEYRVEALLSLIVVFSLIPILKRPYEHYITAFLPVACLLAVCVVRDSLRRYSGRQLIAALAILSLGTVRHYATYVIPPLVRGEYFQQKAVGERIASYLLPGEPLYVLGGEPKYYLLSGHFHTDEVVFVIKDWEHLRPPQTVWDIIQNTPGLYHVLVVQGDLSVVGPVVEVVREEGQHLFTRRVGELETVSLYRIRSTP
ncbi:MAG TPA: glycosyltransferase family 39 protein [Candidatus Latescibacteria bacterium]|nr:glycosyltransferase family 39 protein [Candidatus Latescibacterota bacterium]